MFRYSCCSNIIKEFKVKHLHELPNPDVPIFNMLILSISVKPSLDNFEKE